jgi:hypothetical protein
VELSGQLEATAAELSVSIEWEAGGPQIWSGRGVEHINRYPGGELNPTSRIVAHSITSSLNVNRIKCQPLCGGVLIILFKN